MQLSDLVHAEDVVLGLRDTDLGTAAAQLLRTTLLRRGFGPEETQRLAAAVVTRERELSTDCGDAAIPHARDAALASFVVAVGVNPRGVAENAKARVLFTFLSPEGQRLEHLALLSRISRLARDAPAMDALARAASPEQVLETLRSRGA